jgi:dihydrofolate reductase
MAKVVTGVSSSLDGYIAGPHDGAELPLGAQGERLFEWYSDGDTPSRYYPNFRMSAESAHFFDLMAGRNGAIISGRRTYDISNGWGGAGPMPGVPLFVLTHDAPENPPPSEPPYTFVTEGIERAVEAATAVAGDKNVALMGSAAVQQCLQAGLLDEIHLHVIPVLLGGGVRLLDHLGPDPVMLEQIGVVDAPGVTHLSYRVIR